MAAANGRRARPVRRCSPRLPAPRSRRDSVVRRRARGRRSRRTALRRPRRHRLPILDHREHPYVGASKSVRQPAEVGESRIAHLPAPPAREGAASEARLSRLASQGAMARSRGCRRIARREPEVGDNARIGGFTAMLAQFGDEFRADSR